MIYHQIGGQTSSKATFWNKVSLIFWVGATIALLSFFTFTLFIISLFVGIVILTLKFFRSYQSQKTKSQYSNESSFTNQNYRPRSGKDEDIIDI